jgi:hypothetical protein
MEPPERPRRLRRTRSSARRQLCSPRRSSAGDRSDDAVHRWTASHEPWSALYRPRWATRRPDLGAPRRDTKSEELTLAQEMTFWKAVQNRLPRRSGTRPYPTRTVAKPQILVLLARSRVPDCQAARVLFAVGRPRGQLTLPDPSFQFGPTLLEAGQRPSSPIWCTVTWLAFGGARDVSEAASIRGGAVPRDPFGYQEASEGATS